MKTNAVPFDENAIGQSLALSVNDTILQTALNVDAHRHARSHFGQSVTKSVVEFYIYSPNAASPALTPSAGVPPLTVGVVLPAADLAKYVGEDANGWGYCPGDGNIYNNGSAVATFATCSLNSYIQVTVDFVALSVSWSANGTFLGSVDISAGAYYYAATVSGNPGDLAVWANAGQTPLRYPNATGGWYHQQIGIDPLYIATEDYISAPGDLVPHFKYAAAIDRKQSQIAISRGVKFWPWGPSAPPQLTSGSDIQFTINDPDKIYGELLTEDIRDQLALFARLEQGAAYSTAQEVFSGIIDKCEQPTDQTKVLHCKDKTVLLQSQLVRAMFAPNADPSVAGKPRPLSTGICRTYVPPLFDSTNLYFGAADRPITGVGKMREAGKELAYGIDATILSDAESFSRAEAPSGKWTIETTDFGGAFDPAVTDVLSGDGVFGSCVADGGGTATVSLTSNTIGTGSKTFTVNNFASFYAKAGDIVTVVASTTASMTGSVTSFSGTTLVLNITSVTGSGTFTYWNIANPTNAHSNTNSVVIGTGSKTFNVSSFAGYNTSFKTSCPITLTDSAGAGSVTGTVTSFAGSTLIVNVTSTTGSGTPSNWSITGGIGQPHNWMGFGGYPTTPGTNIFQVKGTSPNKYIEQEQTADAIFGIRHYTKVVQPGQSIAYEVVVTQAPYYGSGVSPSGDPIQLQPGTVAFGGTPSFAAFKAREWGVFATPTATTYRGSFTNTQGVALPLCFAFLCNSMVEGSGGTFSYLDITSIKLIALPDLLTNVALDGPGLDRILQTVMIDHGPLESTDYDPAGAQAIDANGYKYGLHVGPDQTPQVAGCTRPILDSTCADTFENRPGFVTTVQLTGPEDATSVAGTLTVNDIQGFLEPYPDFAENLSTRMSGCKNYDPYTDSDFANVSQTEVPQAVRKLLMQQFQWTVTANAVLAPRYAAAVNTKPLESQLDLQTDGQAEITRVCKLYSVNRNFYVGNFFSDLTRQFEIGDVWEVVYPLPGLETGQQLLIVGVNERPSENISELVLWGL